MELLNIIIYSVETKYFSVVIPTYNSSKYLRELLQSLKNLKFLNDVVITDDCSHSDEYKNLIEIIKEVEFKDLNISLSRNEYNIGGFKNKYKGIELAKNKIVYQVDSDNVITKRTKNFLNDQYNLNLINKGDLFLPSKISLFKKYKIIENILFFRNNDVLFTKRNKELDINEVKDELKKEEINKKDSSFKDRTLKSILNIGNPVFRREDYLNFCKEGFDLKIDISAGDAIALSYFYLKNKGKIIFNRNIGHFHRMRDDSYWHEGGEKSKSADLYFLEKIQNFQKSKNIKNQKTYFITYGTRNFRIAKLHIVNLAKYSGLFDKTIGFNKSSLSAEFRSKYEDILKMKRGAGYWIWKHEIINNVLQEINENDIVVYSDSGSSFNYYAKNRFKHYVDELNASNYGNFRIECESIHKEKDWTTKELFEYFDINDSSPIFSSTQLEATHIMFKKNDHTNFYFDEYKKLLNYDPYLITDKYNMNHQIEGFNENRHDQSIFSLLSKKIGGVTIKNETHFSDNLEDQYDYPFLAVRKHGHGMKDSVKFFINYENIKNKPVFFN